MILSDFGPLREKYSLKINCSGTINFCCQMSVMYVLFFIAFKKCNLKMLIGLLSIFV